MQHSDDALDGHAFRWPPQLAPASGSAPRPAPVIGHGRRRATTVGGPDPQALRRDADREETRREGPGGGVQVHPLSERGAEEVAAEMQLLAGLEVDGIRAAPAVLAVEEGGYVRELVQEVRPGGGRRVDADPLSPCTGEREAQAAARSDLDALVDALHERGWVLGAPAGAGLGRRRDGRVCPVDLRGLRRSEALADRQLDRLWVDSVLGDADRTLRRRIDLPPAGTGERSTPEPAPGTPASTETPGPTGAPAAPAASPSSSPPASPVPSSVDAEPAQHAPVSLPRLPHFSPRRRGADDTCSAGRRRSRQGRRPLILALAAAAVLAVVLGGGALLLTAGQDGGSTSTQADQVPAAPSIEDPSALAARLSADRHAYVTGASGTSVAVSGSPAASEDDALRSAYAGREVRGGAPQLEEVELLSAQGSADTAVLRVVTSTPAHQVVDADGTVHEVAATGPATTVLHLAWTGGTWRIESTEAA